MNPVILVLMLCQPEPGVGNDWHYRTKIAPLPAARCYYQGERMKPRRELYWAEAPKLPPPEPEPGEFELRWKGTQP